MINRFLLFMKMLGKGLFKFAVGTVAFLASIIGVLILAEIIARFKILSIIFLIFLIVVLGFALFIIGDDFWSRYKRERDIRGL